MLEEIPKEDQEQIWLMDWIATQPKIRNYILHIPNQRMCTPGYRRKLGRMGVKAGVSDLFLALPTTQYHGLWLEMKRRKNSKPSREQILWCNLMRDLGYQAEIAYGWEHAKNIIQSYLMS